MNNEQFKKYVQVKLDIDAYIEKRARRKYASDFGVTIDTSAVDEWRVECLTERRVAVVYWIGTKAMIGDTEKYYQYHDIKSFISYEDLELTEVEFNKKYSIIGNNNE